MYEQDKLTLQGKLHLLDEVISPRTEDGPRHVWPSRNGKLLYAVREKCESSQSMNLFDNYNLPHNLR